MPNHAPVQNGCKPLGQRLLILKNAPDKEDDLPFLPLMRAVFSVKGLCCIKTVQ